MKETTVIFDLGNVVVFLDQRKIPRNLALTYGLKEDFILRQKPLLHHTIEDFDRGKISPETFVQKCSEALGVELDPGRFEKIWSEIFTENVPLREIMKVLRSKARLMALSNTNVWHFTYLKKTFEVIGLFDQFILSYQVGCAKPGRKIYEEAVKASKGSNRILYFDDIAEFVTAAKGFGIDAYLYIDENQVRTVLSLNGLL